MRAVVTIVAWVFFACALSCQAASVDQLKSTSGSTGSAHLPPPPYPLQARQRGTNGSGTFRVFFDASGHTAKVVVTKSTGSKILDENTVSFAREHWTGPPNTQVNVPITYDLPKNAPVSTNKVNGQGVCRVIFDAAGRVSKVFMIESTGSEILDKNTVDFAQGNWSGPPNATRDVPIIYKKPK